jgi:methylase of polypeptide subunit release factors
LLGPREQGALRRALGGLLEIANRASGRDRYDRQRLEHVHGSPFLILPSVFNPRVLRTGEFFAEVIAQRRLGENGMVLDMGTGSGVCAVFAARRARQVLAIDINPMAVRCAALNAQLNELEHRIECRHGNLFDALAGERFDAVFFNPPFLQGVPRSARDCAWRSIDVATRFADGLGARLTASGRAYLLLSTFGDACATFVDELERRRYRMSVLASRRYINERVTVVEVCRPDAEAQR